jgi:hypothetical protein
MIAARSETDVPAQDFMESDECYYPSSTYLHSALTHYTLLEILDIFSLCLTAELDFRLISYREHSVLPLQRSVGYCCRGEQFIVIVRFDEAHK